MLLSLAVGSNGKVIAVEAQPRTYELLDWTIEMNGRTTNTKTVNMAMSSTSGGKVAMTFNPLRPLNNHMAETVVRAGSKQEFVVSTITVDDDLVAREKLERERIIKFIINFMKIDVEGAEDLVWAGLKNTLKANPRIIVFIEVNTRRMLRNGKDPKTFYDSLAAAFKTMRVVDTGNDPLNAGRLMSVESLMAADDGMDVFLVLHNT